jgi:hypothetical protein
MSAAGPLLELVFFIPPPSFSAMPPAHEHASHLSHSPGFLCTCGNYF